MRGRTALLAVMLATAGVAAPTNAPAAVTKVPVEFTVTNPGDPLSGEWMIKGFLMRPAGCTSSVLLALHGLSYGKWAWDFPYQPETYSVAGALAARGYAMIAIDELGYGESHGGEPNGYTLTVEAYADMTAQIIRQIRGGAYVGGPAFSKVGLIGHSAGTEIAELTTGLYPDLVEALIATAYTHEPFVNNDWLVREWFLDNQRALMDDYEEFEQGVRAQDMYYLPNADPHVVALDNSMAHLTPSGEVLSIGLQPSRFLLPTITKPVLVLLAEKDELFPGALHGENEMLWFTLAEKTLEIIPNAGHTFMLHKNAAVGNDMIANWLDARQSAIPACS